MLCWLILVFIPSSYPSILISFHPVESEFRWKLLYILFLVLLLLLTLLQGSAHVPPKQILRLWNIVLNEVLGINVFLDLSQFLLPLLLALVKHTIHIQIHILLEIGRVEVNLLFLYHSNFLFLDLRPLGRHWKLLSALRQLLHPLRLALQHLRTSYEKVLLEVLLLAVRDILVSIIVIMMDPCRLDIVCFARF